MTDERTQPNAARRNKVSLAAIQTAALELVAEVGYARLTIEGIASRAGVGKQTIYRWWPSKGAVLFDAMLALSDSADGAESALPDTGDLSLDLKAVLRATVKELNDAKFDAPMRALTIAMMNDPALAEMYEERLGKPLHTIKKARLRSAQAAGHLRKDVNLDVAIDLIWAPVQSRWLERRTLNRAYADAVVDAALDGLS